jgi:hypothetical protein
MIVPIMSMIVHSMDQSRYDDRLTSHAGLAIWKCSSGTRKGSGGSASRFADRAAPLRSERKWLIREQVRGRSRFLSALKGKEKIRKREHPRRAMHCERVVLAHLVSRHEPVTGPSTRSLEVAASLAAQQGVFGLDGIVAADGAVYLTRLDTGGLYRVAIDADGRAGAVTRIAVSPALTAPDGMPLVDARTLLVSRAPARGSASRCPAIPPVRPRGSTASTSRPA